MGVPLGVVIFEPHPREYFNPKGPNFRLTSFHSKARLLERLGVDTLYVLSFDSQMANKTAPDFVLDVLVRGLGVLHVVAGYDFTFGRGRSGNVDVLAWIGLMEGFGVTVVEPVVRPRDEEGAGEIFSSSRIREHIRAGEMRAAARLLGHWWSVEGHVRRGDGRGRLLSFPTVNLDLGRLITPAHGIYAVWAEAQVVVPGGGERVQRVYPGAAYVGSSPTFGESPVQLEVHLLDAQEDLYGQMMRVSFIDFLRPDRAFDSAEALKAQMAEDCARARAVLSAEGSELDAFAAGLDAIVGAKR
jgi:riboflavin kinase/FMN adenylyltransferase